ncbi:arabinogalactan endo-1,4-beta-galactosidase [Flammeovirga pectinis]|uniref:Arabinogalactan endo-beta-1,4-galactanase n=1 Tax=Flammeovirga pectinis TaxID=2494373 RepID=A0A3Q9FTE6_9BACT|nr:glycosyl hydrolase 53 family protein [Flammeovirga pectinis]AZQ64037.1 arabinogalactan endo-1,4-beta-galactosidase [Flammeovirga pectinis]
MKKEFLFYLLITLYILSGCSKDKSPTEEKEPQNFYFGADLSYVNQLLDKGATYKLNGAVTDPYSIFANKGTNLVRFRMWNNPLWTKELYGADGTQMYNDLYDVTTGMQKAKENGMEVLLDLHYSDTWADPGKQHVPKAWENITTLAVLKDSVFNYTLATLNYLKSQELTPEMIQIGNETNCGMMYTDALPSFPKCNVCDENWSNYKSVVNSAISAVKQFNTANGVTIKTMLHVADIKNVDWWYENVTTGADAVNFDIIGISYYPLWHKTIPFADVGKSVGNFKTKFNKEVIIVEVAYPWTSEGNDTMPNLFGTEAPLSGYPFTVEGHLKLMTDLTSDLQNAGALGVVYWEPAWIAYPIKTLWGTGSSWENCTFFDYNNNASSSFDYMKVEY